MSATPGQPDLPTKQKTFIPLENNPTPLTHLSHTLGLTPSLTYHDVYTLPPPPHIPRPAHALIFICPATVYHRAREAENDAMTHYEGCGTEEPVFWCKQTVRHACGLMSCLHALSNGGAKAHILPDSILSKFLIEAEPLKPEARAKILYNSKEIEDAHMAAARLGDTAPPPGEEANGFHFITFVKGGDGHLWELNGGMKGPVDRGVLGEGEDVLGERALNLGVRTFLKRGEGEEGFSLVALGEGGVD